MPGCSEEYRFAVHKPSTSGKDRRRAKKLSHGIWFVCIYIYIYTTVYMRKVDSGPLFVHKFEAGSRWLVQGLESPWPVARGSRQSRGRVLSRTNQRSLRRAVTLCGDDTLSYFEVGQSSSKRYHNAERWFSEKRLGRSRCEGESFNYTTHGLPARVTLEAGETSPVCFCHNNHLE